MYYPGQSISGSIQMVLSKPEWYQYVALKLKGKGKVHWTESRTIGAGQNQRIEIVNYSEKEEYVDLSNVVWGNMQAPQPANIDPGTVNFPFQLTIPKHCPPTFKTETGKIKYRLVGIVSSKEKEYKVKTSLVVGSLIDLNLQPNLLQPVNKSTTKEIVSCCCFNNGEAEITFNIPKSGFCIVKDHIPVTVEYTNGSSKVITLRVEVAQRVVYSADGQKKSENDTIGSFSHEVQATESDTKSFEFELPPTILLGFSSRIITVAHSVRLWVDHWWDLGGFSEAEPPISVPVVIGNVQSSP